MAEQSRGFEVVLDELQQAVKKIESGELSLDESLKVFENGVKAVRECQRELANAEAKIEQLVKSTKDAEPALKPFEPGANA